MPRDSSYDPRIGAIDDGLSGEPKAEQVKKRVLDYGLQLRHINGAIPTGVDIENGELIVIQGPEKHRKTTLALNLVRSWCRSGKLQGGRVLVETLESGMSPKKYKQALVVMQATASMANELYGGVSKFPMLRKALDEYTDMTAIRDARDPASPDGNVGDLFRLSVKYALTADRTPLQHRAITAAVKEVNEWPLIIYGAPIKKGRTKLLETLNGKSPSECLPYRRWQAAVEKLDVRIIVVDHVQGYSGGSAYDVLERAVAYMAAAVAELGVVMIAVSQLSLTSRRSGNEKYARGGARLAEEANLVLLVSYPQNADYMQIECAAARDEPPPTIKVPIEKHSGLLFPASFPV